MSNQDLAIRIDTMTHDVSAIRKILEQGIPQPGTKTSAIAIALGSPPTVEVAGSTTIGRSVALLFLALGLAAVSSGLFMLFFSGSANARSAGTALATIGTLSMVLGGVSLFRDLKIDSVFKFSDVTLIRLVQKEIQAAGTNSPERIGAILKFKPGSPDEVENFDFEKEVRSMAAHWIQSRKAGKNGLLLIVGSTDRMPLNQTTRDRFEANVGLARARAETIRMRIIETVRATAPDFAPKPEQILLLVSGPQQTPVRGTTSEGKVDHIGFPEDRRVDVWAFWNSSRSEGQADK